MSPTKLSLAGNNLIIPGHRKFDVPAGDRKIINLFLQCMYCTLYRSLTFNSTIIAFPNYTNISPLISYIFYCRKYSLDYPLNYSNCRRIPCVCNNNTLEEYSPTLNLIIAYSTIAAGLSLVVSIFSLVIHYLYCIMRNYVYITSVFNKTVNSFQVM